MDGRDLNISKTGMKSRGKMRLNYERKELTDKAVILPSPEGERQGLDLAM